MLLLWDWEPGRLLRRTAASGNGTGLKALGRKKPTSHCQSSSEHTRSWAAVQPDVKLFYFWRPCERQRRALEEEEGGGGEPLVQPVIVEGAVMADRI